MTALLVILASVACACAAFMVGLWKGEQGRRIAAENLLTVGTPERSIARPMTQTVTGEEIARRLGKPFSDETVRRGVTKYMAEMKNAGYELTEAEAKLHVEQMLWQSTTGGVEQDDQAGLFG